MALAGLRSNLFVKDLSYNVFIGVFSWFRHFLYSVHSYFFSALFFLHISWDCFWGRRARPSSCLKYHFQVCLSVSLRWKIQLVALLVNEGAILNQFWGTQTHMYNLWSTVLPQISEPGFWNHSTEIKSWRKNCCNWFISLGKQDGGSELNLTPVQHNETMLARGREGCFGASSCGQTLTFGTIGSLVCSKWNQ